MDFQEFVNLGLSMQIGTPYVIKEVKMIDNFFIQFFLELVYRSPWPSTSYHPSNMFIKVKLPKSSFNFETTHFSPKIIGFSKQQMTPLLDKLVGKHIQYLSFCYCLKYFKIRITTHNVYDNSFFEVYIPEYTQLLAIHDDRAIYDRAHKIFVTNANNFLEQKELCDLKAKNIVNRIYGDSQSFVCSEHERPKEITVTRVHKRIARKKASLFRAT